MKLTNNSEELANEIKENHLMSYRDYCEIKMIYNPTKDGSDYCFRCNKFLEPLTYLEPNFSYIPCWDCAPKKKTEVDFLTSGIIRNIKEFYSKILGDRYLQLFVIDDIYFKTTFPHEYETFKKVVNSLNPPSRNDIWFLDWNVGYPKIISLENLQGLKIVNITRLYNVFELEKDHIDIGDYRIILPEVVRFDQKRQSRYSLFTNGDRKTKRVKVGDICYKLFNTDDPNVKSILKLQRKDGSEVALRSVSYQDYVIIKLAIMRNKTFMRLIYDIIYESFKFMGYYRDTIFLKNTVCLNPKKSDIFFNLIWTPLSEYKNDKYINVSII
jgi:hypothetical protein